MKSYPDAQDSERLESRRGAREMALPVMRGKFLTCRQ